MDHYTNKHKYFVRVFLLLLVLSFLAFCPACKKELKLDTPTNLELNVEEILSWDKVEHATGYRVIVEDADGEFYEIDTSDNCVDLFSYLYSPLEFKIIVYAYDETKKYSDSDDSDIFTYKTDVDMTLYKVRLINDGTEYEIACSNTEELKGKVLIPNQFNGIPITKIATGGFRDCVNITSIIIPLCITEIGRSAFSGCTNLVKVTIPNTIEVLPSGLFHKCVNLRDVNIPNSVIEISSYTFAYCGSLEEIYLPSNVINISSTSFKACNNLVISMDEDNPTYKLDSNCIIQREDNVLVVGTNYSTIPNYVTEIAAYAFSYCEKLERIVIPGNVKIINYHAFEYCTNLKEIIFEEGVEIIRATASGWDSIEKISLPYSAKEISNVWGGSTKECYEFPNGNDRYIIDDGNCIVDLETLTLIKAFEHDVTIPSYVKKIGNGAFYRWEDEYITIPEGVESIELQAFFESNIKKIEFPSSLKYIGDEAFEGCKNLEKIVFNEGLEKIDSMAFMDCYNLTYIVLPKSLKYIYGGAFENCYCTILMYNTIEIIGSSFETCTVFTNIDIKDNKQYIIDSYYRWYRLSTSVLNSDIEDGYVKSFQYLNYEVVEGEANNLHTIYGSFYTIGFGFIPYREGYKFLGWTTNPETNEIEIPVFYEEDIDYDILDLSEGIIHIHLDLPTYQWYVIDMEKEWESGTIFYSVWEKIDE